MRRKRVGGGAERVEGHPAAARFDQDDAHVSTAVSLPSLVITWVLLMLISLIDTRRLRRTGDK